MVRSLRLSNIGVPLFFEGVGLDEARVKWRPQLQLAQSVIMRAFGASEYIVPTVESSCGGLCESRIVAVQIFMRGPEVVGGSGYWWKPAYHLLLKVLLVLY